MTGIYQQCSLLETIKINEGNENMLCKLIEFGLCKVAKMKYFGVKKD